MQSELAVDLAERLLARSFVTEGGCRRWTGAHNPKGYGHIRYDNRAREVHLVAYEIWIGPIPLGHEVDHVHAKGCRHRDCIEPTHLEAITHTENIRRAAELITHCPQGHEYTPDNIKWVTNRGGLRRHRRCRRCFNDARNARMAQKRKEARGNHA